MNGIIQHVAGSVSNSNSHLCGTFGSGTSTRESGGDFYIPEEIGRASCRERV